MTRAPGPGSAAERIGVAAGLSGEPMTGAMRRGGRAQPGSRGQDAESTIIGPRRFGILPRILPDSERVIRGFGEDRHPAVPALGDVVGRFGKDDAREPGHGRCWRRETIVSIGILSPQIRTAARPRPKSAPRRRNRPPRSALRHVQIRSVSRYTPSASGLLFESVQAILAKQLLTDSEARCTIRV